jgi:maltose alpha-D-glucosyltransferase/alpha-amylase
MLLSLPGSPVIYYGDELLMGDNIYLGDRDSVRTPMQWSPDRNGGFSKADFAQLYLPPSMDPVYGFAAVNAEAQLRNPGSFLHWLRGMLVERRALPVFGVGELELLSCPNPSVLAYVRSGEAGGVADPASVEPPSVVGPVGGPPGPAPAAGTPAPRGGVGRQGRDEYPSVVPAGRADDEGTVVEAARRAQAVLCVHNLSRFAQPAELLLGKWVGYTPVEVLGRVPFPVIGDEPYHVTLAPYGYLWFHLVEAPRTPGDALS